MDRQRGFTLLEVLVAFTILALSLGVLMQVFAVGLRNTGLAEDYTIAALHGESVLAALGVEEPLEQGVISGDLEPPFRWQATVTPYVDADLDIDNLNVEVFYVVLDVVWDSDGRERGITLQTLRTVPIPP